MVRLLEASAAGLTNIALLSEEVLVISKKLLFRGIFSSCREVQRQTKVRRSPAGGCAQIRFAVICVKIYFIYSMQPLCTLIPCITLYASCYVTRSGKFDSLLQCWRSWSTVERGRRWTDWWRMPKVGGSFAKYVKPLYCKYLTPHTCKCLNFSSEYANFLSKVVQTLTVIRGGLRMVENVKATLTDSEAPPQTPNERLHLQIVLALLQLANPDPKQINKLANKLNILLLGFQTPDEVASYLEALIRSGTSEEEKSGTVFFMGNTGHWVLSCRER